MENLIYDLLPQKEIILYGLSDYVARLGEYIALVAPKIKKRAYILSTHGDELDKTAFDFAEHDAALKLEDKALPILVLFPAKFHKQAKAKLSEMGFSKIITFSAVLDNKLKIPYLEKVFSQQGKNLNLIYRLPSGNAKDISLEIYQAKSVVDKPISKVKAVPSYVVPIQVGTELTDIRLEDVKAFDNTGDNISARNRRYSEMTAFYWMWKNATADFLGICHYRRVWKDTKKIARKLAAGNIDAVLPLPTIAEHSVHEDYLLHHIPTVWQPLMEEVRRQSPDYYEAAKEIFQGKIFYASNMCILSREVLDDLCNWMFPIVMNVEEKIGDLTDTYYNRYAGFCTERLITLYFLYNKHNWRIAHAEKVFIG